MDVTTHPDFKNFRLATKRRFVQYDRELTALQKTDMQRELTAMYEEEMKRFVSVAKGAGAF